MLSSRFDRRRVIATGGALVAGLAVGPGRVVALQDPGSATPVAMSARPDDVLISAPDLALAVARPEPPVIVALVDREAHLAAHIAGARQVDGPELELPGTTADTIAAWDRSVRPILTRLGVTPLADVVVYDGGSLFAARLWWLLEYLGHERKRVIDGGLPAWVASEQPTESGDAPASDLPSDPQPYPDTATDASRLATRDEVFAALGDPAVVLVDARGPEEYLAGHIPGAVMIPYPTNARPDEPRTFLSPDELVALYAEAGVTPDRRVIPYCSTGVRSAVTYQALRLAGFPDVGLYSGSWAEWSADPELPVETGPGHPGA